MNTMRSKYRRWARGCMLGALCVIGAGCGLGSRDDRAATVPTDGYDTPYFSPLRSVYRVGAIYDIYRVTPDQGPLAGGNLARLDGVFPDPATAAGGLAEIAQMYTVYFGYNIAPYDYASPPTISNAIINVIVPPGNAPGLVDVIFRENLTQLDAATLYYGYEYLDPFAITAVDPDRGPLAGGQQVTIYGRFPIAAPMSTIAEAYGAYRVYFDGRPAGFDTSFNPIITAETMYVITPPGLPPNAPGLVDVSVATMVYSPDTPEFRVLPLSYEYIGDLELTSVTPNRGFIFGDEPVRLGGTFPVTTAFSNALIASQASLYYTAYFGYRIAPFDLTVPTPVITPTQMLVRSPPAAAVGFVDVRVQETPDPLIASTLARAFRYYALYITDVVPDFGPVVGGNGVNLYGLIPAFDSIYSIAEATLYYTVRFDGNVAAFANNTPPNPIILPSQIDTINRTYTIGYMYVIAPPGVPGFADVTIEDNLNIDLPAFCPDCYEYIVGDEISSWDTAEVSPNPVGKLEKGELRVRITGQGTMSNRSDNPVFIVPQGGVPSLPADRIELEELSYLETNSTFTWEGTNVNAIPRLLNNHLVDGHAAIYIEEASGGILGDDNIDLTDGGVIQPAAMEGRHFLIDTVPPRLQLNPSTGGHLRGDDFVNPMMTIGDWRTVSGVVDTGIFPVTQTFPHPYDYSGLLIPAPLAVAVYDAPFDGNWMQRGIFPDSKAQVFFNVSSLTNNFAASAPTVDGVPTENLRFTLDVIFEDADIYTAMNMDQAAIDAGLNADYFGGSRIRQVAGFTDGLSQSRTGLLRDEALTSGDEVLIQWDFQSTPFRLPEFIGVSAAYSSGGPLAAGGNAALSGNLAPAPTLLFGTFDIGEASDPTTGVQLDNSVVRTMMSVVFRAVDRAGDYTPRSNVTPGTKKLYTRNDTNPTGGYSPDQQPEVGPLNLWWMRTTATRLTSNIPASGDTRAPSFTWENTGEPDPGAITDAGEGSERLYSYGIYRTDPTSGTRDEQRDGPYSTLVGSLLTDGGGPGIWSGWTSRSTLTPSDIQQIVGSDEGAWFLLVVMSVDEAGNLELWPEGQLQISSTGGPPAIDLVVDTLGTEERNWERWFVPPSGEAVDTRIEPFYWHDDLTDSTTLPAPELVRRADPGEPSFGDAEVVPYPPRTTFDPNVGVFFQRVSAQFRITMVAEQIGANVEYELIENGQSVILDTALVSEIVGDTYTLVIPIDVGATYLGSANRQPTYYVFRARTFIDADGDGTLDTDEIYDTSPATVQFVVVDNVANYIQNRESEDTQPIQEMDRP